MPSPPITIGELTDVPAFNSPIASPWAQEVSRRIVHRFTSAAERDTKYPAATAGVGAVCEVAGVPYTSNGTIWQGPLTMLQNGTLPNISSGNGNWFTVLWGAATYAGGLIQIDASGNINLAGGDRTAGVWAVTWAIYTSMAIPAGQYCSSRMLWYPAGGGVVNIIGPSNVPGSTEIGATHHFRSAAGGGVIQVQTIHNSSRTITGGLLAIDRVSL